MSGVDGMPAEGNKARSVAVLWQHDGTVRSAPLGRQRAGRGERWRAASVAVVAGVAVLLPLRRSLVHDSFPLSNYPMFTHNPRAVGGFQRAVGVTVDGDEVILSPVLIGGTVEVIHAAQTVSDALRDGRVAGLCAEIAERVAGSRDDVVEVLVVTDRFDSIAGLRADDPQPVDRDVHAMCEVPT